MGNKHPKTDHLVHFNSETARAAGSHPKKTQLGLRATLKRFLNNEIPLPEGKNQKAQALRGYLAAQGFKDTDKIRTTDLLVACDIQDAISKGINSSRERIWNYAEGRPAPLPPGDDGEPIDELEFVD